MKKILLIVLLLIVGCFKEPINFEQMLVERDNVYYTKDTNKPYTGDVFSLFDDGKKKSEEKGVISERKLGFVDTSILESPSELAYVVDIINNIPSI